MCKIHLYLASLLDNIHYSVKLISTLPTLNDLGFCIHIMVFDICEHQDKFSHSKHFV